MALLSPAADAYIEAMALKVHRLTLQRFGSTILMFAPLYLSNVCTNGCRYCGFNARNKVQRRTLTLDETQQEAYIVHGRGFRHILLVTGNAQHLVDNDHIAKAAEQPQVAAAAILASLSRNEPQSPTIHSNDDRLQPDFIKFYKSS